MYGWFWRHLPGNVWVKLLVSVVLALAVVYVLRLMAVVLLGARRGRYKDGRIAAHPPSNIPFLALGAWVLAVGWFGFNVMSAQTLDKISN